MMPCAPYKLRVAHVGNYQTLITFLSYTISSRSTALMMAATTQNTKNTTIRSILQQEKLTGPNFMNWYRNRSEGKLAYLEQPLIHPLYPVASQAACDSYNILYDVQNEVSCIMLGSMSPELQRALENYKAYDMIQELRTMFEE
ncbi:hypothetical protein Tco_0783789 [Tanacetum coccineum]